MLNLFNKVWLGKWLSKSVWEREFMEEIDNNHGHDLGLWCAAPRVMCNLEV